MMRSLATAAIIAITIWTLTDAEKVSPCCVSISKTRIMDPIKDFRLQGRNLPCVKAVIFETERGLFCTDPRQPWVRRKVEELTNLKKKIQSLTPTSKPLTVSTPATQSSAFST